MCRISLFIAPYSMDPILIHPQKCTDGGTTVSISAYTIEVSYVFNPALCVTLNGQILRRWVILWMLLGESYEKHWGCHIHD